MDSNYFAAAPATSSNTTNNDVSMSDPFLSLDSNLDELSTLLANERMDFDMDGAESSWQQAGPSYQHDHHQHHHHHHQHHDQNNVPQQNHHSPPQEYYDPERPRDVNTISSLLTRPIATDDYFSRFSPPNFDLHATCASASSSQGVIDAPYSPSDAYRPMSLAQQLAAPAMTPTNLFVNVEHKPVQMMSPPQVAGASTSSPYVQGYYSPPPPSSASYVYPQHVAQHSVDSASASTYNSPPALRMTPSSSREAQLNEASSPTSPTTTTSNTKEELLRLLVNMSPSAVEKLKKKKKVSDVATPATTTIASPTCPPATTAINNDDAEEDDDESDSGEMNVTPVRRGPKTERRTAHNLIEKKYRCSINDRIQHLKVILAGDEAKLSKSATLRKAIEHIAHLQAENSALKIEVEKLRGVVSSNGLPYPPPEQVRYQSPDFAMHESSPSPPPPSQTTSRNDSKKRRHIQMTTNGGGSERVTLFAMLMAVLIFNPLGFLAASGVVAATTSPRDIVDRKIPVASPFEHGRILMIDDDDANNVAAAAVADASGLMRSLFVWIINIVVVVCVLLRLLVYGEPVQDFKSGAWSNFVKTREQARAELVAHNLREAQRQFCECLVILERPLPSPGIEATISVVWECIRHLLNWLWIGRWLSRRRRSTTTPVSVVCRSHAQTAVLYHEMHQCHLMGIGEYCDDTDDATPTPISGLYLALSAVNLAESAGASPDGLPRSVMAQIYIAAALRSRIALPQLVAPIVAGYFLRRARRHVRRAAEHTVSHLLWLFHPATRKYMSDANRLRSVLDARHKMRFASLVDDGDDVMVSPLSRLRATLKVHLLSKLVAELVGDATHQSRPHHHQVAATTEDAAIDVVDISRLLVAISTQCVVATNAKDESAKFGQWLGRDGDACCTWWTHVLTCGIYWRNGNNELARKHYSLIRKCPNAILKDALGLAVGHALCARKICIEDRESSKVGQFVCMHTKKSLESLRLYSASRAPEVVLAIQEGVRRMAYEWIMSSLLDAWRTNLYTSKPYWTQTFPGHTAFATLYQESFNHYSLINANPGDVVATADCWRLVVYELTCRMLNGANPQTTWSGVRRVRSRRAAAVCGRVAMTRSSQPDAFHLHTLCKLHACLDL